MVQGCESYIAPGTSIDESAITSMSMYVHVQLSVVMLKLKVKMIQMGGPCSPGTRREKAHRTGHLHSSQIGPKSSRWTVSIQHGRNVGPTWVHFGQNDPNFGPTCRLGPNFGPTWLQDGTPWPQSDSHLGATSDQVDVHMASNGRHSRPNPKSSKRPFSPVFSKLFCYRWRFV